MAFDIPFDQQLDVRSHGYINSTLENPMDIPLKFVYCIDYLMLVLEYTTIWVLWDHLEFVVLI